MTLWQIFRRSFINEWRRQWGGENVKLWLVVAAVVFVLLIPVLGFRP